MINNEPLILLLGVFLFVQLEHEVLKALKAHRAMGPNIYLAVSGGVDSMALLEVLSRIKKALKLNIIVLHVHHGPTRSEALKVFRNRCFRLVRAACKERNLEFLSNVSEVSTIKSTAKFTIKPSTGLKSEADWRGFRRQLFSTWVPKGGVIATAHHADDLLETRLIHMIRGAGELGVSSLKFKSNNYIRPLLVYSKSDLKNYCKKRGVGFLNDPTNSSTDPLRNWIRNSWLKDLEKKRKGGVKTLSGSIERLLQQARGGGLDPSELINEEGIDLRALRTLSLAEKKQVLAKYMNDLKLNNYTTSHITEVLKRLDSPEKKHNFRLLKCTWTADARRIKAILNSGTKGTK